MTDIQQAADILNARMEQLSQAIKVNSTEAERSLGRPEARDVRHQRGEELSDVDAGQADEQAAHRVVARLEEHDDAEHGQGQERDVTLFAIIRNISAGGISVYLESDFHIDTLLIVEAMKVMNPITAPEGGVVKKIMVADAQPIEFDQPLVIIG